MALFVSRSPQQGLPPYEYFVRAIIKRLQKTRLVIGPDQPHEDDRRSVAAFHFYANEAQANQPNAQPLEVLFVEFDYDLDSVKDALAQAYDAAKADPRFAGATDA